jgi:ABC-2 type transport system ATP-binding protein
MSEEVIKAEKLTKVFNKHLTAVDHVNFSVNQGEIFGFLGPNGAGKTTTINMLITILKPTEGKASVLGFDIAEQDNNVRDVIGVVPQEYTADEDLTGLENVLLCADLYGIPRDVAKERAMDRSIDRSNLINLPLMFASNAFFPTKFMPDWLQTIAQFNPLSYTTDAVRQLLVFNTDWTKLGMDFAYVGIFAVIIAAIGIVLSWRFLSK